MVWYSTPPASRPAPRLIARSMLSLGTEVFFAFWTASYSVGLPAGSPPPIRAATSMFLISLAKTLARRESITAFLCLVVAHLECPDTREILARAGRRLRSHVDDHRAPGPVAEPAVELVGPVGVRAVDAQPGRRQTGPVEGPEGRDHQRATDPPRPEAGPHAERVGPAVR